MNHRNTHKSKYSWILILCIIVGLLSSLYLVFERHQIEKSQNHIENIVDMMLFYEQMPLKSVPNKKRLMHFAMQV